MIVEFKSERIKTLRDIHDITLEEMAAKLGKVKQQVSIWESGVNMPSLDNLILICNTFDVPISFFVSEVSTTVDDRKAA